jgi:hypothetical protein
MCQLLINDVFTLITDGAAALLNKGRGIAAVTRADGGTREEQ